MIMNKIINLYGGERWHISKLTNQYQEKYMDELIFNDEILANIDPEVKLHSDIKTKPLSSAAACLNVLGPLASNPDELKKYLNSFGLNIKRLIEFPTGADVNGRIYNDKGYVVFEWVGPKKSPINETGGGRGYNRTSVDAFVIAEINGKITQLLIEWKFTEGKTRQLTLEKFSGHKGVERLYRYSQVLKGFRNKDNFPFNFKEEKGPGLYDFSADHLYQLLRITLLAKKTIPLYIGDLKIEDYRVLHLIHSKNDEIKMLQKKHLSHSPGLAEYAEMPLHNVWRKILSKYEKDKFIGGEWDMPLKAISDNVLRDYLIERYCE